MPTLSFYVTDDLAEEVKARKDRINVSHVCAQALRGEVAQLKALERSRPLGINTEALVERLRASKAREETTFVVWGREAGARWAQHHAEYGELQSYGETPLDTDIRLPEGEVDEAKEVEKNQRREGEGFDWEAYIRGWHEAVVDVWEEVKDQV